MMPDQCRIAYEKWIKEGLSEPIVIASDSAVAAYEEGQWRGFKAAYNIPLARPAYDGIDVLEVMYRDLWNAVHNHVSMED